MFSQRYSGHVGSETGVPRVKRKLFVLLLASLMSVLAISQEAALATCAPSDSHCYGEGQYFGGNGTGKGVTGLITVYDHLTQSQTATAAFVGLFIDSNNFMAAGVTDGDSAVGSTAVPRGYSDWRAAGVYGHTAFMCTPTPSTMPRFSVVEVQNFLYEGVVCSVDTNQVIALNGLTPLVLAETEITDYRNTCFAHYTNLKQRQTIGGTWSYWSAIGLFANNPPTVQGVSNSEFGTCGG